MAGKPTQEEIAVFPSVSVTEITKGDFIKIGYDGQYKEVETVYKLEIEEGGRLCRWSVRTTDGNEYYMFNILCYKKNPKQIGHDVSAAKEYTKEEIAAMPIVRFGEAGPHDFIEMSGGLWKEILVLTWNREKRRWSITTTATTDRVEHHILITDAFRYKKNPAKPEGPAFV